MAELPPNRPFLVVSDILYDIKLVDYPSHWAKLKFLKREAYGCGKNGDTIVEGLDLYVRDGPDDHEDFHPALCIGASRGVLNCIGWEIDEKMAAIYGRQVRVTGSVCTVAGDVMVLRVSFIARHDSSYFKSYYLVYDSSAAALFLLPHDVPDREPLCTPFPLKVGQDNCSLVLMTSTPGTLCPFFLTWSPPPVLPEPARKFKVEKHGWIEKGVVALNTPLFSRAPEFTPSVVLLHKGNAIWGDLGIGILYYDCKHLIYEQQPVGKIKLFPSRCKTRYHFDEEPVEVYRNMGCVGDSIWFVTIQPSKEGKCPGETMVNVGETMVTVWTLDLLSEDWKQRIQFKMKTLWKLDGFRTLEMPETVPKFPIVRQGDGGILILYMLLPEPYKGEGGSYARLVGMNFSGNAAKVRLLVHRRLVIPWMERPVVLDSDFFRPRNATV